MDENNLHYSSDDRGVLFNKEKTVLIRAPGLLSGSYVVPAGVITICDEAFWKCSGLTEITIPETVTSMGKYAFCEREGLTSVAVPEGVAVIGDHTFMNCSKLASVTIPSSVTLIDQYAFFSCGRLESIIFEGTGAQWRAIEKGKEWSYSIPATEVICTDGNIPLQ